MAIRTCTGLVAGSAAAALLLGSAPLTAQQEAASPLPNHRVIETRANTFTYTKQQDQSLDISQDGNVLVVWGSRRQEHGNFGVFGQLFDPLGRPLGTELHVNTFLPGNQLEPAVAYAPNGDAWVAWCSISGQDGSLGGIFMRKLSEVDGKFGPVGAEIGVNETTRSDQQDPSIAVNDAGQIMVAWVSDHLGQRTSFGRLFDAQGQPLGGEFQLGKEMEGYESMPGMAPLAEDRFVAVWSRFAESGVAEGIFGRIIDPAKPQCGAEFAVHAEDGWQHLEPSVDSNNADQFVVAWMSTVGDGEYQVTSRRFDAQGKALSDTVRFDKPQSGYHNGAAVAMAEDSRYMVAYNYTDGKVGHEIAERPENSVAVYGVCFDAEGVAQSQAQRLNQFDKGQQTLMVGLNARHMKWSHLDQLAVAWYGRTEEDGSSVALTLFAPESLDAPAPPFVQPVAALDGEDVRTAMLEQKKAMPDWDPNWVDDSHIPAPPPAGGTFGFQAFTSTGWVPPDPDLAVGPDHIVAVVNVDMRFFDKSGNQQFNTGLESFWNTSGFVFDPVALYDWDSQRYIIGAAEHSGSTDHYNIAISDDDNPNGTWYKWRINVNSICDFLDFPNLGVSDDNIILIADCFGNGRNYMHVMDKNSMINNGNPNRTSYLTNGIISQGAVRNYDANGLPFGISSYSPGSPNVGIRAVSGGSLQQFNLNVGGFSNPPGAQQQGTSNQAATIDHRFKQCVIRDGILYAAHNVNGGDGAAKVRWYQIDLRGWPTSGNNPILLDSGDVDDGNNVDSWFGAITANANGTMVISYNGSSSSQFIGIYYTSRDSGDPPGQVDPRTELQISTSPETGSRWGDYSGIQEDPVDGSMWSHLEYRTSSWRTWVGNFDVGGGGPPVDSIVLTGPTNANVGNIVTYAWTSAPPSSSSFLHYSLTNTGTTINGQQFDIGAPFFTAFTGTNTILGTGSFTDTIPPKASGKTVYIEARADSGGSTFDSNMITLVVP